MLLIIAPAQFSEELKPLKTHKDETGIAASIITLDEVYQDFEGKDEAEKVKRCIAQFHRERQIRYVLLVGDSGVFPVRYTKTDRGDKNAFDTAFYATDLYYAALYKEDGTFDDWDSNGNGYYGELQGETHTGEIAVDKVSLDPVVAVGRAPVTSVEQVKRFVKKVISYETKKYDDTPVKKALLMATHDWVLDAYKVNDRLKKSYLRKYECDMLASKGSPCDYAGTLEASKITEIFNSGVDLVGYIGHGETGALAIPGGHWGTADIPKLTNTDRLPIMFASACSTAAFATQPPYETYEDESGARHIGTIRGEKFESFPPQPDCIQKKNDPSSDLATSLLVGTDAGVIAYLGGITGVQMSEPYEYFMQSLSGSETVGETWQAMVRTFYVIQGKPGSLSSPAWFEVAKMHQPWKFMLFGDPSLKIR